MSLPTISQPTFPITIPSTKKQENFRRFLVAEEKKLLMAKQGEDSAAIAEAIIEVAQDCAPEGLDIRSLHTFDLDWIFMSLRAQSVDNIVKVKYTDGEGEEVDLMFSLDDVPMPTVDAASIVINIDGKTSVEVAYPTVDQMSEITKLVLREDNEIPLEDLVVAACIRRVFDDEEEYTADTEEEIFAFINSFPAKAYQELTQFLDASPSLTHTVKYTNAQKEECEVVLNGLTDFFTFR